MNIGVLFKVY